MADEKIDLQRMFPSGIPTIGFFGDDKREELDVVSGTYRRMAERIETGLKDSNERKQALAALEASFNWASKSVRNDGLRFGGFDSGEREDRLRFHSSHGLEITPRFVCDLKPDTVVVPAEIALGWRSKAFSLNCQNDDIIKRNGELCAEIESLKAQLETARGDKAA